MDVVDLRNFYAHPLGTVARRFIGRSIRRLWRTGAGQRVLGVGYVTPYLGLFREDAERCLAFMPAGQGVVKWPSSRPRSRRLSTIANCRSPTARSTAFSSCMRWSRATTARRCCVKRGACLRPAAASSLSCPIGAACGRAGHDAVRPWPSLFALADHLSVAGNVVHPDSMGRRPLRAADRSALVPALGLCVGAHRCDGVGAVAGVHLVEATKQVYRAIPARKKKLVPSLKPVLEPVLAPSPGGAARTR